jgi:anti-sigma B factor antagonist
MELAVHEDQGVTVVGITGELDATNSPQLGQLLDRLLAEGRRRFAIDLKGVNFIDSSGLSTLVRLFKHVRGSAGNLCLADLQPPVRRILELTRLDRAFDIYTDAAAAVRRLTGK